MMFHYLKVLTAVLATASLGACTSPTPRFDSSFGQSVNTAKLQQTLNPDASANTDPVSGLGGPAAAESVQRYHDTFKAPPPTFEIILGTGAASGRN